MAQLNNVKPGDLIKAADWNALVAAIQGLSAPVTVGPIVVPNLFGLQLGNAVAIITLPSTQLAVGNVLDSLGNPIDITQVDSQHLIVLNQMPVPGTNVYAGSSVNLVVAPKPGSAPPPPKIPTITGFSATALNPAPIGSQVEIDGTNFDTQLGNNQVTFAGVSAPPPSSGNPQQLFVMVPTGIPGAPVNPGDKLAVPVIVTTTQGSSLPQSCTIGPPLAVPLPVITGISPANPLGGTVNQDITITGTGFGSTPANDQVGFENVSATPKSGSSTQLVVTIPAGITGIKNVGDTRTVNVTVTVGGQTSPAFGYTVTKLS